MNTNQTKTKNMARTKSTKHPSKETVWNINHDKVESTLERWIPILNADISNQRDVLYTMLMEIAKWKDEQNKPTTKRTKRKPNNKQEPAWSEADEEKYLSCLQLLGAGNKEQPDTINTMWLKSLKNRVQSIAKFVGEEQYMKGLRDGVDDVIKNPEDYGLLPTPF